METSRKDFVRGVGGLALGVPLGAVGARLALRPPAEAPAVLRPPPSPAAPVQGHFSYAQAGEDVIVHFFFAHLQIKDVSYLDIGAYDPILINNTYFFYRQGRRGVLVEPNATMCEKLRAVRPEDTTLEAGIGVTAAREADYYLMSEPSWNTFDKKEAEHQAKVTGGKVFIKEVRKIPLLNVNDVIDEHFKGKAPAFVSIDAEGWHFAILKSIDFKRFRPQVICVETLVSGEHRSMPEIPVFMASQDYVARGGSFVNTIFVDSRII